MNRFLLLALLFFWSGFIQAQVSFHNLHEVLQYADKNSLVNRQATLQQSISEKDRTISKSGLLPKVNIFATGDYYPLIPVLVVPDAAVGGSPDKFQKIQAGLPWSFSSGVELSVPVINLAKWQELKRYRLQTIQTSWDEKTNLEDLHIQITQAYYQALLAKALLNLSDSNTVISDELLRIMEVRKNNQLVDPADYNRTRNLELDIQTSAIDYRRNYELSIIALRQLLHLSANSPFILDDSVSSPDWKHFPDDVPAENRPGWRAAEARVAVAEAQYQEALKSGKPAISLNGKLTYQSQVDPSASETINYFFSNIGLRLDFPIFQGNYYKTGREKSALQLDLARVSQQQTNDEISRQQAEWKSNYEAAIRKQAVLDQKMKLTADNLRIAELNLKEGIMEFETFNNIFREYIETRIGYLQNLSDGTVYKLLLTQNW